MINYERIYELVSEATRHFAKNPKLALDKLDEAFELGYVPGAQQPKEWRNTTAVGFITDMYHPKNKVHFLETLLEVGERLEARVKGKGEAVDWDIEEDFKPPRKYTPEEVEKIKNDLEEQRRKSGRYFLKYGNTDKQYWLDWSKEMRQYI